MPDTDLARPSSRYGDRDSANTPGGIGGKVLAIAAVLMVALVIAAAARNYLQRQAVPVTASFVTQEAVDDATTRLWIDVTRRDPSIDSYCIVTAVNYDFAEVGRREVIIPAGGEELIHVGVDLPVREPAVSGRIYGCSENIPFYMDTSRTYTEAYPTPAP
ncbi:DUF4307 domain-containing protein [Corynebacterium lipophiloflavum]|uniref:DUF4307 domain-containing protein n=1 Tax=Corynebacterium lipophiloflavum TaxID=161889 RepID=UPI00058AC0B1|nr:DUF4307 domain-containing protein [Corynebacterium lipophiloflavum]